MRPVCIVLFIFLTINSFAQDQIITKQDEAITVRIIKENKKEVVYYNSDDPHHVILTLQKKEIKKIIFEKGSDDINLILIRNDSLMNDDLLSDIIGYLMTLGYEIESFSKKDLTVNTKYNSGHRITVFTMGHDAHFICYYAESNVGAYPPTNGMFSYGKKPNKGEKRSYFKTRSFNTLDEVCRTYLINGTSTLAYRENVSF